MNIVIASMGLGSRETLRSGAADGSLAAGALAIVGLVLLYAAVRLLRDAPAPHTVRYDAQRF